VYRKFTSCEEHDARFQVDSRRRRPPTRWRDSELSRIRTTHTVHVVRTCILDRCTFSSTSSTQGCDFSVLCEVSLALKGNVTRKESWFDIITSISAFRRSNRGGRTCSTRKMRSVGSIADDFQVIFSGHISCPFAGRSVLGPHVSCSRRDNMYMLRSPTVAWSPGVRRVPLRSKICLEMEPSKFCLGPVFEPQRRRESSV